MASYSVAQAKNELPRLISLAESGEHVVITRRGVPVATITPTNVERKRQGDEAFERMWSLCQQLQPSGIASVQLLNGMYEEDD